MRTILLLMAILLVTSCYAQEWSSIYEDDEKEVFMCPNSETMAWIKSVARKAKYFDKAKKIKISYTMELMKFDCDKKQLGQVSILIYGSSGKVLYQYEENEYLVDMEYVVPDSLGEYFLNLFCKKE